MSDERKYYICHLIDQQMRIVGLPVDEAVPIAVIMGLGFLFGQLVFALLAAIGFWALIRHLKKGQGSSFLFNALYWFLPGDIMSAVFKKLPSSSIRYWRK